MKYRFRSTNSRALPESARDFLTAAVDLVLPPLCPLCRESLRRSEATVCSRCTAELSRGDSDAKRFEDRWSKILELPVTIAAPYRDRVRQVLVAAKWHDPTLGSRILVPHVAARLRDRPRDRSLGERPALLPVPRDPWRRLRHGPPLAERLARGLVPELAPELRLELALPPRRRIRRPQTALDGRRRRANTRGAFVATSRATANWKDRTIVIVDDVLTTGSTIRSLATLLRDSGVEDVRAVVVAAADPDPLPL